MGSQLGIHLDAPWDYPTPQPVMRILLKSGFLIHTCGLSINEKERNNGGAYACRYSRGQLIPIISVCNRAQGIKGPLEYLQA